MAAVEPARKEAPDQGQESGDVQQPVAAVSQQIAQQAVRSEKVEEGQRADPLCFQGIAEIGGVDVAGRGRGVDALQQEENQRRLLAGVEMRRGLLVV